MEGRDVSVGDMTAKQLEDFVFTAPRCFSVADTQFRELLEKGTIFIHSKESSGGGDKFTTAVQARSFPAEVFGLPLGALGAHDSLISRWDIGVDRLYLGGTPRASPNRLTVPAKVNPPLTI